MLLQLKILSLLSLNRDVPSVDVPSTSFSVSSVESPVMPTLHSCLVDVDVFPVVNQDFPINYSADVEELVGVYILDNIDSTPSVVDCSGSEHAIIQEDHNSSDDNHDASHFINLSNENDFVTPGTNYKTVH